MNDLRTEIREQAPSAYVQYAIFRWESAIVLAGTLLLSVFLAQPFPGWPLWGWPLLGALALAGVIYSSVTDPETNARVLWQLLRERLNPDHIKDPQLQEEVETAFTYQRHIEAEILRSRGKPQGALEPIADELITWVAQLFQLARYVDTYGRDYRIEERKQQMAAELQSLGGRRQFERNPEILNRLDQAMKAMEKEKELLVTLETQIREGERQLEQHLTLLEHVRRAVEALTGEREVGEEQFARLETEIHEYVAQVSIRVEKIHFLYTEALQKS